MKDEILLDMSKLDSSLIYGEEAEENLGKDPEVQKLKDPDHWQDQIRQLAKEENFSEEEINRILEEEAPKDLLENWLKSEEEPIELGE